MSNLIGISLCLLQDRFEFITLSEENYYLSTAPIDLHTQLLSGRHGLAHLHQYRAPLQVSVDGA